jgi:hypothetical protein
MKLFSRHLILIVIGCIMALGATTTFAAASFEMPTDEQIDAIANDPSLLKGFIENADEDQTVEILIRVIGRLNELPDITEAVKGARIATMFEVVRQMHPDRAATIIARVWKRVNPRLLPIIRDGGAPTPPYTGQ